MCPMVLGPQPGLVVWGRNVRHSNVVPNGASSIWPRPASKTPGRHLTDLLNGASSIWPRHKQRTPPRHPRHTKTEAASFSADRLGDLYPVRDLNPCYRRERAAS